MRLSHFLPLAALAVAAAHAAEPPSPSPEKLVDGVTAKPDQFQQMCVIAQPIFSTRRSPVDEVIAQPGVFDQMCDMPKPVAARLPIYIYGLVRDREMRPSDEQIATLQARRAEVGPVLVSRLKAMDLSKPGRPLGEVKFKDGDEAVEKSGLNPHGLSGTFYAMLIGLDAVEALPELLRLEEQMRSLLAAAEANPKLAPPVVPMDGLLVPPQGPAKLSKRDVKMLDGRAVQRELLSVMLSLLRGQRYPPLLASELEAKYAAVVKARAQKDDLRAIKTPADAKAKEMAYLKFDPILGVPLGWPEQPVTVPFTPESRNLVRSLVAQFLQNVPPAQWKVSTPPAP